MYLHVTHLTGMPNGLGSLSTNELDAAVGAKIIYYARKRLCRCISKRDNACE